MQIHGSEECKVHLRNCNFLEMLGCRIPSKGDEVCFMLVQSSWYLEDKHSVEEK